MALSNHAGHPSHWQQAEHPLAAMVALAQEFDAHGSAGGHPPVESRVEDLIRTFELSGAARSALLCGDLPSALAVECARPKAPLAQLLVGDNTAEVTARDRGVIIDVRGHRIVLNFGQHLAASVEIARAAKASGVKSVAVVGIDRDQCHVVRLDHSSGLSTTSGSLTALCDDIDLSGSLWSVIFPTHRAILLRTYALSTIDRSRGALFNLDALRRFRWAIGGGSLRRGGTLDERLAFSGLQKFSLQLASSHSESRVLRYQLRPLDAFIDQVHRTYPTSPARLFQTDDGLVRMTGYDPPHSRLLRFGETTEYRTPARGDYVTDYRARFSKRFFNRDFVIVPAPLDISHAGLYAATAEIANILGFRRTGLFQLAFSKRIYTIVLPAGIVHLRPPDPTVLLVPCMIAYRGDFRPTFRRTFTLSIMAIPVARDSSCKPPADNTLDFAPTPVDPATIHRLNDILAAVNTVSVADPGAVLAIEGPLAELLPDAGGLSGLAGLTESLLAMVASASVGGRSRRRGHRRARSMVTDARSESRLSSILVQVAWRTRAAEKSPWEKFVRTGGDSAFRRAVHRLIYFIDSIDDERSRTTAETTRLDLMQISNSFGDDLGGTTFLDPDSQTKFLIYPSSREHYPNQSILRWMGFALFADSALASLKSLLARSNARLSSRHSLSRMVVSLQELIESFAELYNLDIRRHLYRQEYERLKSILRIDDDYAQLNSKVDTLTQAASLREQRLVNRVILAVATATLAATAIAVLATVGQWSLRSVLIIGGSAIAATVIGSVFLLEPIRRLLGGGR